MGKCCVCKEEGLRCGYCMADDINTPKAPKLQPEQRTIAVMIDGAKVCDIVTTHFQLSHNQVGVYEVDIKGLVFDPDASHSSISKFHEGLMGLFSRGHFSVPKPEDLPPCPKCGYTQ